MKQRLLSVLVLLVVVAALGFASNGDTINIGGYVTLKLNLTVTPDGAADNLTLEGVAGATTATIALITITTNSTAGWELWVFATNADATSTALINEDLDEIPYTITYAGLGTAPAADITNAGLKVGENVAADGGAANAALSIAYGLGPNYPAGYYSDQLAIVLRAK